MGFKSRRLQRVALGANDRFERMLRKHPRMKRRVRRLYLRLNGQPAGSHISRDVRLELAERFREPNARLADQLAAVRICRCPHGSNPHPSPSHDARLPHANRPSRRTASGYRDPGSLAQQAEHRAFNPLVQGSSPWRPTAGTIRRDAPGVPDRRRGRHSDVARRASRAPCGTPATRLPSWARPPRTSSSWSAVTHAEVLVIGALPDLPMVELVRRAARVAGARRGRPAARPGWAQRRSPSSWASTSKGWSRGRSTPTPSSPWSARIRAGERVVDPGCSSATEPATSKPSRPARSTAREREVLVLLAAGHSNREIASSLYVSLPTVKTHLAHIYAKLGAKNRNEALGRAVAAGLLVGRPGEATSTVFCPEVVANGGFRHPRSCRWSPYADRGRICVPRKEFPGCSCSPAIEPEHHDRDGHRGDRARGAG